MWNIQNRPLLPAVTDQKDSAEQPETCCMEGGGIVRITGG